MFHVEHTSFYDDISTIYCQSYYTNPKLIHQNKKHRVSRETRCLYYVYKSYQHMPVVFPDLIRDLLCIDCKNLKFHSTRSGAKAVECGSRVLEVERLGVVVVGGVHRLELGVVLQHVDLRFAAVVADECSGDADPFVTGLVHGTDFDQSRRHIP